MPIAEEVLNDGRTAIEPITVHCGATGCKRCFLCSNTDEIDCNSCKEKHKSQDLKNTPVMSVETLVQSNISDLIEYTKMNLDKTVSSLEGKIEIFY
jgi:hypothetical protein